MKKLLLFLILIGSSVDAARYEEAVANYNDKQYRLSMEQFLELAELGNKDAQYAIGAMYINGHGVEKDKVKGLAWVKLSSTRGLDVGKSLIQTLEKSLSDEQIAQADKYLLKIEKQYGDAQTIELRRPVLSKDTKGEFRSYSLLKRPHAKYPKQMLSQSIMGSVLLEYDLDSYGRTRHHRFISYSNEGFKDVSLKALRSTLYKPSTIESKAIPTYGLRIRHSFYLEGAEPDREKILSLVAEMKEKAEKGSSIARYQFANALFIFRSLLEANEEESLPDDFPNSADWFYKSAIDGLPHGKYNLGSTMLYGEQCKADKDSSYFWLKSAAVDGFAEAQFMLGLERYHGVRFDKDERQGIDWLRQAADNGYDHARVVVSKILATHSDEKVNDPGKALEYLKQVKAKKYYDRLSYLEASAAVYASLGEFKKAISFQKKLIKLAKKNEIPYDDFESNMILLESGKSVRVEI